MQEHTYRPIAGAALRVAAPGRPLAETRPKSASLDGAGSCHSPLDEDVVDARRRIQTASTPPGFRRSTNTKRAASALNCVPWLHGTPIEQLHGATTSGARTVCLVAARGIGRATVRENKDVLSKMPRRLQVSLTLPWQA